MRIYTQTRLSPVSSFRADEFDTPAGKRVKNCACSFYTPCLYHWYYENKGGARPNDDYRRGQVDETPQRSPRKRNGVTAHDRRPSDKRRYASPESSLPGGADTPVREAGGRTGLPHHTKRKSKRK